MVFTTIDFIDFTNSGDLLESPSPDNLSHTNNTAVSVCFQEWVVQFAHRVVLTRGLTVRFYPANVSI